MKAKRLYSLFHAICAIALHGASASAGEIEWRDGASLQLEGRGFPGQTSSPYVRIPDRWRDSIPVEVWRVSRTSMGLCARFATDSHTVAVRWDVGKIPAPHPQMAPGGQTGIDIYRRPRGGVWQHVRMATPDPETARAEGRVAWTPGDECLVYLPMRTRDLRSFEIGFETGAAIEALPPHAVPKPVVHYGTSIVHGSRASRPGMAFTAIMSRLADVELVNLGFPGLGKMEPPMAELLAEIDASLYIVDCDWNMEPEMQAERYEPFVRRLRELRPDTPILLCGGCVETGVPRPQEVFARSVFDRLKAEDPEKWANLHFLSGVGQLPVSSDATTDHIHPNDFGLAHMGPVYAEAVCRILGINPNADKEQKHEQDQDQD